MKKTLLMALMLIASAITAHAQGFRVYRSDGTVYQYSWVADRIEFYEGDGDPDWVEPIPESVQRALEELQTFVANNAACISRNTEDIQALNVQCKNLANETETNETNIRALQDQSGELQRSIDDNARSITMLNDKVNMNEEDIRTLQDQSQALQTNITKNKDNIYNLYGKVDRNEADIENLQHRNDDLEAHIAALQARLNELEEIVRQLAQ